MSRYSPMESSWRWVVRNLATEALWRRFPERYLMLRYEDFVRQPHGSMKRVLDLIHEKTPRLPFVSESVIELGITHTVWGNPNRLQTGTIKLQLDEKWMLGMRWRDRISVTWLTWPLLIRYRSFAKRIS